jgi:hypothetical protein
VLAAPEMGCRVGEASTSWDGRPTHPSDTAHDVASRYVAREPHPLLGRELSHHAPWGQLWAARCGSRCATVHRPSRPSRWRPWRAAPRSGAARSFWASGAPSGQPGSRHGWAGAVTPCTSSSGGLRVTVCWCLLQIGSSEGLYTEESPVRRPPSHLSTLLHSPPPPSLSIPTQSSAGSLDTPLPTRRC